MRITSKGFQFLLEDVNTQLWDLLLVYLEESQVRALSRPPVALKRPPADPRLPQDLVETIGFLFMLSSLELGRVSLAASRLLGDGADSLVPARPTSPTVSATLSWAC